MAAPPARAEAAHLIDAPASLVYAILADYREHRPRILPKPTVRSLRVEKGGNGEGTEVVVVVRVLGSQTTLRVRVTEPVPGRVLQERDLVSGAVTTFTVDPRAADRGCHVTVVTEWPPAGGVRGWFRRTVNPRIARSLYEEQLRALDAYAHRLGRPAVGTAGW